MLNSRYPARDVRVPSIHRVFPLTPKNTLEVGDNKKPLTKCEGFLSAVRMGLEPTTSGVTGPHSNQLNYRTG